MRQGQLLELKRDELDDCGCVLRLERSKGYVVRRWKKRERASGEDGG